MTDPSLQILLPSFMLVALLVTFFWNQIKFFLGVKNDISSIKLNYKRTNRISRVFLIAFIFFILMTIIYSIFPELYFIFIPLDSFDHPIINTLGVFILKISLIWIIVAQINIDKELYKHSRNIDDLRTMELIHYSEKMLLNGLIILFIGMFVTITNVVGIIIGLIPIAVYHNFFKSNNIKIII